MGFVKDSPLHRHRHVRPLPRRATLVRSRYPPRWAFRCGPARLAPVLARCGVASERLFGQELPRSRSCSARAVSHGFGGLLRTCFAGLLHPAANHEVRPVSGPPSPLRCSGPASPLGDDESASLRPRSRPEGLAPAHHRLVMSGPRSEDPERAERVETSAGLRVLPEGSRTSLSVASTDVACTQRCFRPSVLVPTEVGPAQPGGAGLRGLAAAVRRRTTTSRSRCGVRPHLDGSVAGTNEASALPRPSLGRGHPSKPFPRPEPVPRRRGPLPPRRYHLRSRAGGRPRGLDTSEEASPPGVSAGRAAASAVRLPLLPLSMVESVAARGIAAGGPPDAPLGFSIIPPRGEVTGSDLPEGMPYQLPHPGSAKSGSPFQHLAALGVRWDFTVVPATPEGAPGPRILSPAFGQHPVRRPRAARPQRQTSWSRYARLAEARKARAPCMEQRLLRRFFASPPEPR